MEPLSVLSQSPKRKSELRRCVAIFIFVFKFFLLRNLQRVSSALDCWINLAISEKSEKFWCGVNDKVTMGSTGGWSMGKNEGV